jgi:hypothetical protein
MSRDSTRSLKVRAGNVPVAAALVSGELSDEPGSNSGTSYEVRAGSRSKTRYSAVPQEGDMFLETVRREVVCGASVSSQPGFRATAILTGALDQWPIR